MEPGWAHRDGSPPDGDEMSDLAGLTRPRGAVRGPDDQSWIPLPPPSPVSSASGGGYGDGVEGGGWDIDLEAGLIVTGFGWVRDGLGCVMSLCMWPFVGSCMRVCPCLSSSVGICECVHVCVFIWKVKITERKENQTGPKAITLIT